MKDRYLITEPPLKALLCFSLPMILGNMIQQIYTIADSAVVGRYVGSQALAAIGASYALTTVFIWVAIGGGIGASVIVSRHFGAGDHGRMKSAVCTAFIAFLILSILLGLTGFILSRGIMTLLNTPADTIDLAVTYLRIYFLGLPFLFMYNIISSMFNALGNSRTPLIFLIFSSLLNIVLDILLVTRFHLGVAGVAWATLLAQGLSMILSFLVFMRKFRSYPEKGSVFDKNELKDMTRVAIPSIIQQSIVSVGMMLVQSVVNSFGSEALAGYSAAIRIDSLIAVPMSSVGNALSSFVSQNLGAKEPGRCKKGYHAADILIGLYGVIVCIVLECFSRPIISLFLGSNLTEEALATGSSYLIFLGWFFSVLGFKMVTDGLLRGAGDTKVYAFSNIVNLGIRLAAAFGLAGSVGISILWTAQPIGWFFNWMISYLYYRTGRWKNLRVFSSQNTPK